VDDILDAEGDAEKRWASGRLGICVQQLPGLAPQSAESAFFGDECPHLRLACLEVIFQITDVSDKIQLAGTKAPRKAS